MTETNVHACTDITGFGLLGHACEMVEGADVGMVIHSAAVPYFPEAKELAGMGMLPAGLHRNREFRTSMIEIDGGVPGYLADIVAVKGDPLSDIDVVINNVKWVMKDGKVVVDKRKN